MIQRIINKIKYNALKLKITILGNYNLKDIETKDELIIKENISLNEIENLIYIKDNAQIKFTFHPTYDKKDEKQHYERLREIFKILEKHKRTYNISIYVENRELFRKSNALNYVSNINLTIMSDLNTYTKEEYIEEEKKLCSLIEPIKNSNLSPYEKYLAVYNIVKQFKTYKENPDDPSSARSIKEILKNEYIVCVGFSNLLTTLLDKVEIPSISISVFVEDDSLTRFIPFEDKPVILSGHERNLIKIDDDKYNIHGIYIADPTWDNSTKLDLYNTAAITFDKLKESKYLEKIGPQDYLFDIHSFEEFQNKINFWLQRELKYKPLRRKSNTYKDKVIRAYRYVCEHILKLLYKLDRNKWQLLSTEYNTILKNTDKDTIPLKEIEESYSTFLTNIGYYILNLSNKEININKTFEAANNVKRIINKYNDEELITWKKQTKYVYEEIESILYPYQYNPKDTRINFLEDKPKKLIKNK